jgi:hypothetical protein
VSQPNSESDRWEISFLFFGENFPTKVFSPIPSASLIVTAATEISRGSSSSRLGNEIENKEGRRLQIPPQDTANKKPFSKMKYVQESNYSTAPFYIDFIALMHMIKTWRSIDL